MVHTDQLCMQHKFTDRSPHGRPWPWPKWKCDLDVGSVDTDQLRRVRPLLGARLKVGKETKSEVHLHIMHNYAPA